MRIDVLTIFPEYLEPLRHALLGRAIEQGLLEVGVHDLRDWATGVHRAVDDTPYGGGPGMVMMPSVWGPALDSVAAGDIAEKATVASASMHKTHVAVDSDQPHYADADPSAIAGEDPSLPLLIVPTPAGVPFTQAHARAWAKEEHLVFACGRYEGIDSRVVVDAAQRYRVREVSIGDYVLIGGEVATLVMAEAVVRLVPGVLGNAASHEEDSFSDGLLEGPCYTKPVQWRGLEVPKVLRSGDHSAIAQWRREQALRLTAQRRPELLSQVELSDTDRLALNGRDLVLEVHGGPKPKHLRRVLKEHQCIDNVAHNDGLLHLRTSLDDAELLELLAAHKAQAIIRAPQAL